MNSHIQSTVHGPQSTVGVRSHVRSLESRVLSPESVHGPQSTVYGPQTKGAETRKGSGKPNAGAGNPEWWTRLAWEERALIRAVFRLLGRAKRSEAPELAQAAVKWERSLGCFIKVRLITEGRRAERRQPLMDTGRQSRGFALKR
jgi:hypothetical protein